MVTGYYQPTTGFSICLLPEPPLAFTLDWSVGVFFFTTPCYPPLFVPGQLRGGLHHFDSNNLAWVLHASLVDLVSEVFLDLTFFFEDVLKFPL